MEVASEARKVLADFTPRHEFFVGIDSDGCVFDSMEIKHKECFIPNIIKFWGLQPVAKYAREAAEFVNLYSQWRGANRFPALVKALDLLREHPEVQRRKFVVPDVTALRKFIESGVPLGNPALRQAVASTNDPVLVRTLQWSEAVNASVADIVHGVPPFPLVRESLERLSQHADIMVVSGTPGEALQREWQEHDIARFAAMIAGQEVGSKKEQLRLATQGRYAPGRMLMVGDAPGDLEAARANNFLFYPIIPGREEDCWARFYNEIIDQFLAGKYTAELEAEFVGEFRARLPERPPWC
ncbi:MAG: HAD hydrolase-like protein [bacterium]|jgi:phosphoglycolate phosphatase-like HAD superfamily hydrolase|nr:HAD hydrolase-like protein [candidate division KSB1 bacterium]MDH7558637.1 HAD hydrolase-like protein [bacterium]